MRLVQIINFYNICTYIKQESIDFATFSLNLPRTTLITPINKGKPKQIALEA